MRTAEETKNYDTLFVNVEKGTFARKKVFEDDVLYIKCSIMNDRIIQALKDAADMCDETEDGRFEHKSSILNLINQLK